MDGGRRWAKVLIWVSVAVLLSVAIAMVVTGISDLGDEHELDTVGIEVPADVLDADVHSGGDRGPFSTLTVRFKPRGDDPTTTTAEVTYDGDFEADHGQTDEVRVEYDPDRPEHARLVGERGDAVDRTVAGSIFTALLLALALLYWRRPDIVGQ